jgi:hypothetical protein
MSSKKAKEARRRLGVLARAVADEADADLLLYAGPITRHGFEHVEECLRERKAKRKNVLLFVTTLGGDAHAAFRIARCVGGKYERFAVVVSSVCKSAGTLLCLGANELVMSDAGELGPLDVQLRKEDEIYDFGSSLDTMQTLQLLEERALSTFRKYVLDIHLGGQLSTHLAGELSSNLTVGLYSELYSQLDPVRLGEVYRSMLIASDYGERLTRRGRNAKDGAIGKLVGGYPSHEFVIDRHEAGELFHGVREPTDRELELAQLIENDIQDLDSLNVLWVDELGFDEQGEAGDVPSSADVSGAAVSAEGPTGTGASARAEGSVDRQTGEGGLAEPPDGVARVPERTVRADVRS